MRPFLFHRNGWLNPFTGDFSLTVNTPDDAPAGIVNLFQGIHLQFKTEAVKIKLTESLTIKSME
jgi:hypothetical protein